MTAIMIKMKAAMTKVVMMRTIKIDETIKKFCVVLTVRFTIFIV